MRAAPLPFQPSLLAAGPTGREVSFASCQRIDLGAGAWVDVTPGWLAGADSLFTSLLHGVHWQQREVALHGRILPEPRLTAWWGPDGPAASRLGRAPEALRRLVLPLDDRYGHGFDAIGLNLYRTGRDSVAWHGDRLQRERPVTLVAVLSLGSPRRFLLRPAGGGTSRRIEMFSGDLLVMGGTCQRTWQHSVPKVAHAGPRISATFRRFLSPAERGGAASVRATARGAGPGPTG